MATESKVNDNSRWQPMPANNTLSRTDMAVGSIATVLACAGAIYGLWVAFFYDGGTAGLVPFAIAACVGAVCAGIRAASAVSPGHGLWPALCGPDTRRDMLSKSSPFASPTLNG